MKISTAALQRMAEEYTEVKTYELWERMIAEAPVKTGFLKSSIVMERTGTAKYVVDSQAPYTSAVIYGHLVRGQEKGDAAMMAKIAKNTGEEGPGSVPPNPFMQRALDDMAL